MFNVFCFDHPLNEIVEYRLFVLGTVQSIAEFNRLERQKFDYSSSEYAFKMLMDMLTEIEQDDESF
jgi:hypothetical protein